ncbi:glycosyltransferase family 4 protein [Paenibacillus sp. CN-4]|uniref:glycosyltransferase family 4 protein n=1 Tax=Paenibacillus nanchangensis TaxID=3348343 RepID=UPI003978DB4B
MKVLWICNIPLPQISRNLGITEYSVGGWILGFSNFLKNIPEIELHYCFPLTNIKEVITGELDSICYYAYPAISRIKGIPIMDDLRINDKLVSSLSNIINSVKPDILHIFGTEMPHAYVATRAFGNKDKVVVNIQGLVSVIHEHFYADLPCRVKVRYKLGDIIRGNIVQQARRYFKRGINEVKALNNAKHVIGRTDWDKAASTQINPQLTYHFCNEILRETFYKSPKWELNKCKRYTIFFSQAWQPLKGLHYLLKALPTILEKFPDTKVYVAGADVTNGANFKKRLRKTSYGYYVEELIRKNNLVDNVFFTGPLTEEEMCTAFLNAHVFVSASTIENESNSVSEAKLLGVPVVSSFVGGVTNRIEHGSSGFMYQHDATYMLAHYICEIFNNDQLALKFSEEAKKNAEVVHDIQVNGNRLLNIYKEILEQ